MVARIRPATPEDTPLLARVMLLASRSQLPRGAWDLLLANDETRCLGFLERMALAEKPSFCHRSGFLVAEAGGRGAAALTGYDAQDPRLVPPDQAILEGLRALGLDDAECAAALGRLDPFVTCLPEDEEGAWIVEFVAALPDFRRQGLVSALLDEMLAQGRRLGYRRAQISILIGNTAAQRAYEKAGFTIVQERRHPAFQTALGCPGTARMMRDI